MSDSTINKLFSRKIDPNKTEIQVAPASTQEDDLSEQLQRIEQKKAKALAKLDADKERIATKADRAKNYEKISILVNKESYKQLKIYATNEEKFIWEIVDEAISAYIQSRK